MSWADWHSKPVARSLAILAGLGVLGRVEGRTRDGAGLVAFSVEVLRTDLTPGFPGEAPISGTSFIVCMRRELHAVATEACRLAHLAKGRK